MSLFCGVFTGLVSLRATSLKIMDLEMLEIKSKVMKRKFHCYVSLLYLQYTDHCFCATVGLRVDLIGV